MVISPNLAILLGGVGLLLVGKWWAGKCYFRELGKPYRSMGWHCDSSLEDPRLR